MDRCRWPTRARGIPGAAGSRSACVSPRAGPRRGRRASTRRLGGGGAGDLDPKTGALVRLAALVALGSSAACYQELVCAAVELGATEQEVIDTMIAVASTIGMARLVSASPRVALGLGYDVEAAFEGLHPDDPRPVEPGGSDLVSPEQEELLRRLSLGDEGVAGVGPGPVDDRRVCGLEPRPVGVGADAGGRPHRHGGRRWPPTSGRWSRRSRRGPATPTSSTCSSRSPPSSAWPASRRPRPSWPWPSATTSRARRADDRAPSPRHCGFPTALGDDQNGRGADGDRVTTSSRARSVQ